MVFHEFVDVEVFPLLKFVDFNSQFKLKLFLHFLKFTVVLPFKLVKMAIIFLDHVLFFFSMIFFKDFCLFDVLFLILYEFFLKLLFVFFHVFHSIFEVTVLFFFCVLAVVLNVDV